MLLDQVYNVPVTAPEKATSVAVSPAQITTSEGSVTVGVGYTVIVVVAGVPEHEPSTGVTVIVAV